MVVGMGYFTHKGFQSNKQKNREKTMLFGLCYLQKHAQAKQLTLKTSRINAC